MLKFGNLEFRNLEEQVQKNQVDIAEMKGSVFANGLGIKVVGVVDTEGDLPASGSEYGNAYLVGEDTPYDLYVWTRASIESQHPDDYWLNLGNLAIIGPQGIKGEKGDKGDKGDTGETGPQGIQGPQGVKGATGDPGADGQIGPEGPKGDKGDPAQFIKVAGKLTSISELPDPAVLGHLDYAYLVGENNDVYIQVGETPDEAQWENIGSLNVATYVTVDGQYVGIFNADTKLNVKTDDGTYVYTHIGASQSHQAFSGNADGNTIAMRTNGGQLRVADPVVDGDAINKRTLESKMPFIATYGETTGVEIGEALDAGREVLVLYSGQYYCRLSYISSGYYNFTLNVEAKSYNIYVSKSDTAGNWQSENYTFAKTVMGTANENQIPSSYAVGRLVSTFVNSKVPFIATYGTTTADEIEEALDNGQVVIAKNGQYYYGNLRDYTTDYIFYMSTNGDFEQITCRKSDSAWSSKTIRKENNLITKTTSNDYYPTSKAVAAYVDNKSHYVHNILISGSDPDYAFIKFSFTSDSSTPITDIDDIYLTSPVAVYGLTDAVYFGGTIEGRVTQGALGPLTVNISGIIIDDMGTYLSKEITFFEPYEVNDTVI